MRFPDVFLLAYRDSYKKKAEIDREYEIARELLFKQQKERDIMRQNDLGKNLILFKISLSLHIYLFTLLHAFIHSKIWVFGAYTR